jgi:hypothetical protein
LTDERVFIPRAWEEEEKESKTDAGGHGVRDRASTERGAERNRIALAKNMAADRDPGVTGGRSGRGVRQQAGVREGI